MRKTGRFTWAVCFSPALCLFLGLFSVVAQGAQTYPPYFQNTTPSETLTTPSWASLETLSEELSVKANSLVPQVVDLNNQVASLNDQLGRLQHSLSESEMLLERSLDMREKEEMAARKAVQAALNRSLWWQRGLFVVAGGFAGYLAKGWVGAAYGVGVGIASDAVLELSITFKLFK